MHYRQIYIILQQRIPLLLILLKEKLYEAEEKEDDSIDKRICGRWLERQKMQINNLSGQIKSQEEAIESIINSSAGLSGKISGVRDDDKEKEDDAI